RRANTRPEPCARSCSAPRGSTIVTPRRSTVVRSRATVSRSPYRLRTYRSEPRMTTIAPPQAETSTAELLALFRPIFDRIAVGAVERDTTRRNAHEEVEWLKQARFGALRVPVAEGGFGATLEQEH